MYFFFLPAWLYNAIIAAAAVSQAVPYSAVKRFIWECTSAVTATGAQLRKVWYYNRRWPTHNTFLRGFSIVTHWIEWVAIKMWEGMNQISHREMIWGAGFQENLKNSEKSHSYLEWNWCICIFPGEVDILLKMSRYMENK